MNKHSGARLERQIANRSIDYNHTGSNSRRNRTRGTGDGDESDSSIQSYDWAGEEFSVHGTADVVVLSNLLRGYGLSGPANFGIARDDYERVKVTPTTSPVESSRVSHNGAGPSSISFRSEPELVTFQTQPSFTSSSPPRQPSVSPREKSPGEAAGQPIVRAVEKSGQSLLATGETIGPPTEGEDDVSRLRPGNSFPSSSPLPKVSPGPGDDSASSRGSKGFSQVVREAVAQMHRNEEDALAVKSFIGLHGGDHEDEILRSGSAPPDMFALRDSGESPYTPGQSRMMQVRGEPMDPSSPRATEPPLLGARNGSVQKSTDSFQKKRQQGDLGVRSDDKKSSFSGSLSVGTLKPPPLMSVFRLPLEGVSTHDMLDALAPDNNHSPDNRFSSESDEGEEPENGEVESGSSDGDELRDSNESQQSTNWMAIELRDVDPESIAAVVGQNPEPQLVKAPSASSPTTRGPSYPWTKGQLLGAGSFGTVYEAVDSEGSFFAVKEVSLVECDQQAQDAISQLMQELDLLSRFQHENIVQYHGTDRADGKLYIFLEYVAQGSLASVYKKYKKLSDSQIRAYTRQILKGLKYLHDQNIMHRDIKCANILVDTKGICKLADFGMAKQVSSIDQGKSTKGSAYWMAPEVIRPKKTYGKSADIWSLGCSVLEMATGSPPFSNMEWFQVIFTVGRGIAPPIPEFLSDQAKDFVRQCLEIKPFKRPTATELLQHPFVRQAAGLTPTSSSSIQISERSLEVISEETSGDFSNGSRLLATE